MYTGYSSVSFIANLSYGQRQLVLGDNSVGKTTLLSNILKNLAFQRFYTSLNLCNVYSFYTFVGSSKREFVFYSNVHKCFNKFYNYFIDATISSSAINQFVQPIYVSKYCLHLAFNGLNVLAVLDSLDKHAKIHRSLMLEIRRSPGREAYPADIFYIHSNLLERSGKFGLFFGGGSFTCFPIVETQQEIITDYITTNLISITDGQLFLSKDLCLRSLFPAINKDFSISRLGFSSQPKIFHKVGKIFRDLLQSYTILSELRSCSILTRKDAAIFYKSCRVYLSMFIKKAFTITKLFLLIF